MTKPVRIASFSARSGSWLDHDDRLDPRPEG
jgi:hypothetical protein